ncbi:hypothetical protein [Streptomyces sp. NRRL B-24085]|uniref:hypothetical protein n=1 Tax=Streptomyces sp. NRRL B-24085 TaxID=1709476 RepID=UPI0006B388AB|nr:hypothetical protein [Streptomyces sp. NRRL B-24085]
MTTPGSRQAQQNYQQQVRHNSATFARNAAHHNQLRYRGTHPRGPVGVIRRLLGLVFSVVFLVIALGIFLMILSAVAPDWFDHVKTWFEGTF